MKIKTAAMRRAIEAELAERNRRGRAEERLRRDEIYKKIPKIKQIDENMMSIAFDMGRRIMAEQEPGDTRALAEGLIDFKMQERAALLTSNGYPADYLDSRYSCPLCHDTGRIGNELCRCVAQLAINAAFETSGLNPLENFRNFNLDLQRSPRDRLAMGRIRDAAFAYADTFPDSEKRDIVYLGPSGVGKTYLLNCIGGHILERGYSVLKINAHRLIQMTLDTLRLDPDEKPDFILPDLLIIDDLGTEPMIPNITIETLLSILCQRQDLCRATAVASNLEITSSDGSEAETLQSMYGERFTSRLLASKTSKIQNIKTANLRFG